MIIRKMIDGKFVADLPNSGDEDEEENDFVVDTDTCSRREIEQLFRDKYRIADEGVISLKKDYVVNLGSNRSFSRIAAGTSNDTVSVYELSNERGLSLSVQLEGVPLTGNGKQLPANCGVRFLDETGFNLLVGSTSGIIRLYDLRTKEVQARFQEEPERPQKYFTTFDCNANSRIISVGTELDNSEVCLIFYDVRQRQLIGGYMESHSKDVSAIRFHDVNPNLLCTGSLGLINIFDLKKTCEEDALQLTINTESSVNKLNWHQDLYKKDIISCITNTYDLKVYDEDEGELIACFGRMNVTEAYKRKAIANCNVIGCHSMPNGQIFLLVGTYIHKGQVMRSLYLQNKQLLPLADFDGNKQIIRDSVWDMKSKVMVTAGESGIVTVWKPAAVEQASAAVGHSGKLKIKAESKSNKTIPY